MSEHRLTDAEIMAIEKRATNDGAVSDRHLLLADRLALLAEIAAATATIAEQTHRADANDAKAAVWREKYEALELDYAMEIGTAADLGRDLATERAARIAAEGQEAGLREAIASLVKDYPIDDERHFGPAAPMRVPLGDLRRLAVAAWQKREGDSDGANG